MFESSPKERKSIEGAEPTQHFERPRHEPIAAHSLIADYYFYNAMDAVLGALEAQNGHSCANRLEYKDALPFYQLREKVRKNRAFTFSFLREAILYSTYENIRVIMTERIKEYQKKSIIPHRISRSRARIRSATPPDMKTVYHSGSEKEITHFLQEALRFLRIWTLSKKDIKEGKENYMTLMTKVGLALWNPNSDFSNFNWAADTLFTLRHKNNTRTVADKADGLIQVDDRRLEAVFRIQDLALSPGVFVHELSLLDGAETQFHIAEKQADFRALKKALDHLDRIPAWGIKTGNAKRTLGDESSLPRMSK